MNRLLYVKLASTNIRKNMQVYIPYILTCAGMILVYYILRSMAYNDNIYNYETHKSAFEGADVISEFLVIASNVAGVFSFIFLLFANSFVMKRRKKQLGLYSILGMERKHIAYVMLMETLMIAAFSMAAGLLSGLLLDKLMLMLLLRILKKEVWNGFYINGTILIHTLLLFASVFAITLSLNLVQIIRSSTIDLLKGDNVGEKEPKTKLLITILGVVSLTIGYAIAIRVDNTIDAITYFFAAVIFVMIGTYLLFIAGSITILKTLRKNKKFYYKTQNFINISGMIYRMKQNAAGLASICLLSTSAILVLSAGAALYAGGESSIEMEFPSEIKILVDNPPTQTATWMEQCVQSTENKTGLKAENRIGFEYYEALMLLEKDTLNYTTRLMDGGVYDIYFVTQQEFNRLSGEKISLSDNEILLYDMNKDYKRDTITIGQKEYNVIRTFENEFMNHMRNIAISIFSDMAIVVPDQDVLEQMLGKYADEAEYFYYYGFDVDGSTEEIRHFGNIMEEELGATGLNQKISLKQDLKELFLATYGCVFYIGIFLGALFLIATVLMIYYKQISEGFDDKERFVIMQKVGMTKTEIRKTIHAQVLMVFFLPLVAAIIHMAFALHIVTLFIRSVVIIETPLMILCAVVTALIFSVVYCGVYGITSREYYRIVND